MATSNVLGVSSVLSEVEEDFLFLGSKEALEHVVDMKITHIISVSDKKIETPEGWKGDIRQVDIRDLPHTNLYKFFGEVTGYIAELHKQQQQKKQNWEEEVKQDEPDGGTERDGEEEEKDIRLLVISEEGQSRAPAIVLAHMVLGGLTLKRAFVLLRTKRISCNPNNGFMRQLLKFEGEVHGIESLPKTFFQEDWGFGCMELIMHLHDEEEAQKLKEQQKAGQTDLQTMQTLQNDFQSFSTKLQSRREKKDSK